MNQNMNFNNNNYLNNPYNNQNPNPNQNYNENFNFNSFQPMNQINNQNMNQNNNANIYSMNNNNNNLNNIYVNGNGYYPPNNNNNNEVLTPSGYEKKEKKEKEEIDKYYKDLKEEEKKDKELVEFYRRHSSIYLIKKLSFNYSDFKKAPTTYIENDNLNLTYMTCVIQCLANISPIAKYYLKEKMKFAEHLNRYALNYAFSRIISNIYSFPQEEEKQFYNNFRIDEFKRLVIEINRIYQGKSTKNAEEFLHFLLEQLRLEQEKTLKKNKSLIEKDFNHNDFKIYYKELLAQNNSLFFNCFNLVIKKERACKKDEKHKTVQYQNYLTYQLDIENYIKKRIINLSEQKEKQIKNIEINIVDCLKNDFLTTELFSIYCPQCGEKVDFEQYNSMVISPNYFMFLTGLRNDPSNTIEKFYRNNLEGVETFIFKIQEEIDLSDIIKNDNCHKKYRLDGLISYNFYEKDRNKICYTAFYRSPIDNKWYLYIYGQNQFQSIDVSFVLESFEKFNLMPSILIYSHK